MQPAFQAPMGWQAWPAGQQPGFWLQPAAAVVSAAAPAGELPLAVTQLGFTAWVAAGLPQLQLVSACCHGTNAEISQVLRTALPPCRPALSPCPADLHRGGCHTN